MDRGTLLNNRYRIVEILGQGGMGSVYRAIDENLGVEVAVKENLFTTEDYARQFRREAVILASLRHPNLPRVTDHFVIEGQGQYLVMDYIEGEDLRQRMDRVGVISEEEAISIGASTCDALTYLDSRTLPIVHRDIKPGNIKITPQGHIYLVDFGLAKILEGSHITTTGARAMTPGYSPPEQYGTARTDHRSDIFSLGATLYAALTGVIPEDALARAMEQVELTTIRKRNPKISKRMAGVLERALEIRPDDRFQTAEQFKQALLSVRGISRRKTGEYTVPPPPELPSEAVYVQEGVQNNSPGHAVFDRISENNSPTPIPISAQLSAPASRPRSRPRRRKGSFMWAIWILVLLFLGTALIYAYFPTLPTQAMGRFVPDFLKLPSAGTEPAVIVLPSATLSPTVTPTLAPTMTTTTSVPERISTTPAPIVLPPTPTPVPAPTQEGGGGGMIAYASDQDGTVQIWVMKLADKKAEPVTDIPEGACQPDWSPDGTQLVFISPCTRNQELYPGAGLFLLTLGSNDPPTPLTTGFGGDFNPAWSPDGTQIAFTSLRNSGRPHIYLLNLADSSINPLSEQYSRDSQPTWSNDGKTIAFISSRKGIAQVWVMNADGTDQQPFSKSGAQINSNPDWSPDGQTILFTQIGRVGDIPTLVTASYDGEDYNEFPLNLGLLPAREARFSPDGLWLIFESWPKAGNHDIYISAANGSQRDQLTTSPRPDFDPAWKPAPSEP